MMTLFQAAIRHPLKYSCNLNTRLIVFASIQIIIKKKQHENYPLH